MSLFGDIIKTTVNVVTLPVDIVKDVVTLGGDAMDGGKTHTTKKLEKIIDDLDD